MRRPGPRPAADAVLALAERLAPQTALSSLQRVWAQAVGEAIAAQAHPTAERAGVVTVTCSSAVWAQELDLMAPALVERLNAALGGERVRSLRCQATPARGWARGAGP
jgi:predicted nucleic acid-binding Zn ribbon protein